MDFTLSALVRRKAKNLSLLVVYTLIVFFFASVMLFCSALKKEAALIQKFYPDCRNGSWPAFGRPFLVLCSSIST